MEGDAMLKRLSRLGRLHGELEARGAEALEQLNKPGGLSDQAEAMVGLARALADGVAEELIRRLPFRMLYTPRPTPAPAWTPPKEVLIDPLAAMTVVALKDEARRLGLAVPRRIKKRDLIELIRAA